MKGSACPFGVCGTQDRKNQAFLMRQAGVLLKAHGIHLLAMLLHPKPCGLALVRESCRPSHVGCNAVVSLSWGEVLVLHLYKSIS